MPRVVLVPGLGLDARSSARLRRRLTADVVPLPGMGLKEPVPSVDDLAERLCAAGAGPARAGRPLAELPGRGRGRRRPAGQRDRAVRADDGPPAALAPRAGRTLAGDGAARAAVAVPAGAGPVAPHGTAGDGGAVALGRPGPHGPAARGRARARRRGPGDPRRALPGRLGAAAGRCRAARAPGRAARCGAHDRADPPRRGGGRRARPRARGGLIGRRRAAGDRAALLLRATMAPWHPPLPRPARCCATCARAVRGAGPTWSRSPGPRATRSARGWTS